MIEQETDEYGRLYIGVVKLNGRLWDVLQRTGGTVTIYSPIPGGHAVAIDDCGPVVFWAAGIAEQLEAQFQRMREVSTLALQAIENVKKAQGGETAVRTCQ
jgi:hypothetical protein